MFLMCSEKVRATDYDSVSIKIDISFRVKIVFIYLYKYLYYIQNTYLFAMHTQKITPSNIFKKSFKNTNVFFAFLKHELPI